MAITVAQDTSLRTGLRAYQEPILPMRSEQHEASGEDSHGDSLQVACTLGLEGASRVIKSRLLLLQDTQSYNPVNKYTRLHLKTSQVVCPRSCYPEAVPKPPSLMIRNLLHIPSLLFLASLFPFVLLPTLSFSFNNSSPSLRCTLSERLHFAVPCLLS